ncbi:hypothetical protein V2W30_12625 [Streptomyces sp. Q6]|uniref:Uncharacterized protein n=1 Tax=Streptomyces citrinus TaxID=3118173 RepID=A0ACD5AA75_9ACTN
MTRTTPPRPLDPEALFPGLRAYRRTTTRLHPRPGTAGPAESSVGGPLLWPADEPWPVCAAAHRKNTGYRLAHVRAYRELLAAAWRRDPGHGPTEAEREELTRLGRRERRVPGIEDEDPVPLLAAAQFYARDIPDLPAGPDGADLLQVLWCPFEAHGPERSIDVVLRWRRAADVTRALAVMPEPRLAGRRECVPAPCVLDPEQVVEHEYADLLDDALRDAVDAWEDEQLALEEAALEAAEEEPGGSYASFAEYEAAMAARPAPPETFSYRHDLSIAPGWKVGGYASWHLTDPARVDCSVCRTPMRPLLTVGSGEWDGTTSWVPLEDRHLIGAPGASTPTEVHLGRDEMRVFVCPDDLTHPHRLSFQ